MRGRDAGDFLGFKIGEQLHFEALGMKSVELAKRFIEQHKLGAAGKRTGQRYALLLTAGKVTGFYICPWRKFEKFEKFCNARIFSSFVGVGKMFPDVFAHRHIRHQIEVLGHVFKTVIARNQMKFRSEDLALFV